jgi:hypothetical protein
MKLFPFRIKPQSLCDIHECFSVFFYRNLPDVVTQATRAELANSTVDWPDSDASDSEGSVKLW